MPVEPWYNYYLSVKQPPHYIQPPSSSSERLKSVGYDISMKAATSLLQLQSFGPWLYNPYKVDALCH